MREESNEIRRTLILKKLEEQNITRKQLTDKTCLDYSSFIKWLGRRHKNLPHEAFEKIAHELNAPEILMVGKTRRSWHLRSSKPHEVLDRFAENDRLPSRTFDRNPVSSLLTCEMQFQVAKARYGQSPHAEEGKAAIEWMMTWQAGRIRQYEALERGDMPPRTLFMLWSDLRRFLELKWPFHQCSIPMAAVNMDGTRRRLRNRGIQLRLIDDGPKSRFAAQLDLVRALARSEAVATIGNHAVCEKTDGATVIWSESLEDVHRTQRVMDRLSELALPEDAQLTVVSALDHYQHQLDWVQSRGERDGKALCLPNRLRDFINN